MILRVGLEMFGEVVDALAEDGDLHFRGAGVGVVCLVAADEFGLAVLASTPRAVLHARPRTSMGSPHRSPYPDRRMNLASVSRSIQRLNMLHQNNDGMQRAVGRGVRRSPTSCPAGSSSRTRAARHGCAATASARCRGADDRCRASTRATPVLGQRQPRQVRQQRRQRSTSRAAPRRVRRASSVVERDRLAPAQNAPPASAAAPRGARRSRAPRRGRAPATARRSRREHATRSAHQIAVEHDEQLERVRRSRWTGCSSTGLVDARAQLVARARPPIFLAENGGGVCMERPAKRARAPSSIVARTATRRPSSDASPVEPLGIVGVGARCPRRTSASYSLSSPTRNCASRVARPTTSGSTPVASGSSVPVWPMRGRRSARAHARDDVVRRRARPACRRRGRRHAVAVSVSLRSASGRDRRPCRDRRRSSSCDDAARGPRRAVRSSVQPAAFLWPPPPNALATRATSTSSFERMLIAHVAVGAELEEHDGLNLPRGQRQVDQPFGVVVRACRVACSISSSRYSTARRPSSVELHRVEHRADQLQPAEAVAVEDAPRHRRRVRRRPRRSARQMSNVRGVMFEWWNDPVSVRIAR